MALNPISAQTGRVRRDFTVRIPAGLTATTTVLVARPLRPIKVRSFSGVSEDAGTSPVFTMKLQTSAAEDANKDPGADSDLCSATSLVANVGRRVSPALTATDCVAGASLECVLTRTSGTLGAFLIHVEYEEDLE
jgi:hypothetical protein